MIHHTQCPVCNSREMKEIMLIKDFSVTGESFSVFGCGHCGLVFTQDIPAPNEITPYYKSEQYVSHTDTNRGVINRLYHLVRKFTLRRKKNLILKTVGLPKGSILDVGSGTGGFLNVMRGSGWDITGIEQDATALENAWQLHGIKSFAPEKLFLFPSESFDAITLWHVLEHVHDLEKEMHEFLRVLKKNGRLFIAVPNHTSYDAHYYKQYWAAWDVPRHLYHFSPAAMQFLSEQYGFKVERMIPMWFDSFYISMLSEKYKHGRNGLFHAVWIGLVSNFKALINKKRCSSVIYVLSKKSAE